jgi:hypothetical protein
MNVELFRGNKKIAGPLQYDHQTIKSIIISHGGNGELVPVVFTSSMVINTIAIKRVIEDRPPISRIQRHVFDSRTVSEGEVVYAYTVEDNTVSGVQSQMLSELSRMHDDYESKRVLWEGMLVKVDLEARIAIKDTLDRFVAGVTTVTEWRGKEPVETINGEQGYGKGLRVIIDSVPKMQSLYIAGMGYLEKGFIARKTIEDEINAESVTLAELDAIDIRSVWDAIVTA